jgi:hypothetical protein
MHKKAMKTCTKGCSEASSPRILWLYLLVESISNIIYLSLCGTPSLSS